MHENKRKLLIAEDEEVNFFLLREWMAQLGITAVWAKNGEEAVELSKKEKFDIVIMDMKMPVKDGFEATRIIRELDKDVPIIALTAYAMEQDRKKCLDAGCSSYLSKPVMKEELFGVLDLYVKR